MLTEAKMEKMLADEAAKKVPSYQGKLKPEIKTRWIEALESGKYPQTEGVLTVANSTDDERPVGDCCLGVLCKLAEEEGVVKGFPHKGTEFTQVYYGENEEDACGGTLPPEVAEWAGFGAATSPMVVAELPDFHGKNSGEPYVRRVTLVELNDQAGFDFKRIAQVIREHL